MAGEYKLVVSRGGEVVQETDWFDNIVLDLGLNRLGVQSGDYFRYCRLGTGVSTPIESQMTLDSQIGYTSRSSSQSDSCYNVGAPTYACLYTFSYTFAQGSVIGNVSEIGVGWGATGNSLFSRALITDSYGNPTSISIIAIDQLTVYYRFKMFPTLTDSSGSFVINGEVYNYQSRIAAVSNFGANNSLWYYNWAQPNSITYYNASPTLPTLGAITGNVAGTGGSSWGTNQSYGSAGISGYVNNSFSLDSSVYVGIQLGNCTGGIGGVQLAFGIYTSSINYQFVFDKAIPKDATKVLTLNFRITWSRI